MSTLSAIREGFETVVEAAITGLRVYPYESDGALEYPCLVVQITDEIPYDIGALGANGGPTATMLQHDHSSGTITPLRNCQQRTKTFRFESMFVEAVTHQAARDCLLQSTSCEGLRIDFVRWPIH